MTESNGENSSVNHAQLISDQILGPILHRWLLGLHQHMSYFDDGNTTFLFCARAGVRIRDLYSIFVSGLPSEEKSIEYQLFWISRVLAAKGTFSKARDRSINLISTEFERANIEDIVQSLLCHNPDLLKKIKLDDATKEGGSHFSEFLATDHPTARILNDYFRQCGVDFDNYIQSLTNTNKRVVLIDSGWKGSTQSLLTHAYPQVEWKGLYFGKILTENHDETIQKDVIGILFESDIFDPDYPISAFTAHRHVIESLLEPNGTSIEEVPFGATSAIAEKMIETNVNEKIDDFEDRIFVNVKNYIQSNIGLSLVEIEQRYQKACRDLPSILITPTRLDAQSLYFKDRSADFGRSQKAPILIDENSDRFTSSDARIEASLWPQGQIALEYKGKFARDLQLRAIGLTDDISYFDPLSITEFENSEPAKIQNEVKTDPTVAIITRTKNRPLLLKRAAASVLNQTYKNYVWVIVNDGGDVDVVKDVIEECSVDRRKIRLVSNESSLGMEAASNCGIKSCDSDYILIHDDDDSLHPDFLQEMVSYLETPNGKKYGGAISKSIYVSEEIRGNEVIEHKTHPYQDWVRNVHISEMMVGNFYAPISFVYRRSVYNEIGGYDEELPVLGDWFFNLEFLVREDIGVVPRHLAYYHHRDRGDSSRAGIYANSVIGGISKHEEYAAIVRNRFIRKYSNSEIALGALFGYTIHEVRQRNTELQNLLGSYPDRSKGLNDVDMIDYADRMWLIANINLIIVRNKGLKQLVAGSRNLLEADAAWPKVLMKFKDLSSQVSVPPNFDDETYLEENSDVKNAVKNNHFTAGYVHYILHGRKEGRRRPTIDATS